MTKLFPATLAIHAFLYLVLGAVGLSLAISPGYSSPVFPASGLALALSIRFGWQGVLAVFAGSLALNLGSSAWNSSLTSQAFLLSTLIASGSALQCTLGSLLVRKLMHPGWEYLDNEKSIFNFLLVGGALACLCSASVGVSSMYFLGFISLDEVLYSWWTWYVGDALGVFLAAPLFLLLFQKRETTDWSRFRSIGISLALAILFAGSAFFAASQWESQSIADRVAEEGENVLDLVESRVIAHQEMLSSLNRLIEINPNINQSQFDHFTRLTLSDEKDVFALSFNPLVETRQRLQFESRTAELLNFPGYQIRERDDKKQLKAASLRPLHVPVVFISPLEQNRQAVGFDIFSDPIRKQAIENSLVSKKGAVTAPVQLVQEQKAKRYGVLLMQPIFSRSDVLDDNTGVIGFGVAVIKVDEMVQIALENELNPQMALKVADAGTQNGEAVFFQTANWAEAPQGSRFAWRSTVDVADRQWQLEMVPTTGYLKENRPVTAWAVGVLGMLFAALLQVMLLAVSGRAELVKRTVQEQTLFIQDQKQQLEVTSEQANAANLAKSRFLATMSHELRTPMNGILGIAKLMQIEASSPKQKEQSEIILNSGEMLLNLLNDILDISKIEAGKIEFHSHRFSPKNILNDVNRLYQAQAHHKKISLKASWEGHPDDTFMGDSSRIRQVLINLVSNAMKFTTRGHIHISAKVVHSTLGNAQTLYFQVEDTGIGIAPEKLGQLFQPFSQLDDSYQRRHAGTGLGLSIVKNMAELMGGEVGVESALNTGSTFWFTVPVLPADENKAIEKNGRQNALSAGLSNLSKFQGTVLVVEDDQVNQTVIQAFLKKLGVDSDHAANGIIAVEKIKSGYRPDLILMDIQMPGLDGYDATREIRAFEQSNFLEPIPIIALTAAAFPEERARCFKAGMNDFLSKPVSLNELQQAVSEYLKKG